MLDPELKQYLDKQFEEQTDLILRTTKDGFDGVDEQFKRVDDQFKRVDDQFKAVDLRFDTVEDDITDLKKRMTAVEDELITLSANVVTKQYLDTKIELLLSQPPISKAEGVRKTVIAVLPHLERASIIPSEERAKYERMIM